MGSYSNQHPIAWIIRRRFRIHEIEGEIAMAMTILHGMDSKYRTALIMMKCKKMNISPLHYTVKKNPETTL